MKPYDSDFWKEFNTLLEAKYLASIVDIEAMIEQGKHVNQKKRNKDDN